MPSQGQTSVTSYGLLTITVTGSFRILTEFPFNPSLELFLWHMWPNYEFVIYNHSTVLYACQDFLKRSITQLQMQLKVLF